MDIIISNSSGKPIYEQITSQIKNMILVGELKAGDALPSMRLMARELRISVITTKRAYEDLERDGFIELQEYIGSVDDERIMRQINTAMKKTLGLWFYKPVKEENIRCLCHKCLNDYIENPDFIVRRLDPFARVKGNCDRCNNLGWDYVVTERNIKK